MQYEKKMWIIQLHGNMLENYLLSYFLCYLRWLPFMSEGVIHSEIELYPQGKVYCNFMEVRSVICNIFL